jgi:mono/diheme cytochrome c family protein
MCNPRIGATGVKRFKFQFDPGAPIGRGVVLAAFVASVPAFAADPGNGERLARRWCEPCHVVSQTHAGSGTDQAPPFPTIAKRPNFDAGQVALFLLSPHPKMPDMNLTRAEAADLAAYIATLK